MVTQNNDKDTPIDDSVLDETPPNINTPQKDDDQDPNPDPKKEEGDDDGEPKEEELVDEPKVEDGTKPKKTEEAPVETPEQKEQRYKAQQTEAQIQAARNRALTEKVDEASKIAEPTVDELKVYVTTKGAEWDDLTPFEQSMAKDTFISNKRFSLVNESVQESKKIDEWSGKVDTFIDENDGKPEYALLSGHEADFRKFSLKESHRGTPVDILAAAFIHQLPPAKKVRGALFDRSGGGERPGNPNKIVDADASAILRQTNPREWKRQVKAGNITIEV